VPVFYRSAGSPPEGEAVPVYLHTAPTSSGDWLGALERTGGIAPDLIGFGRSGKGGHLDYSPHGIARFVVALLGELGVQRVRLVGHGWGAAVAVALAAQPPLAVEALVLIDAAPPLGDGGWHRLARLWRAPLIGELVMGSITRGMLARALRGASAGPDAWPEGRVRHVWEQFDQGTQRATLRLHRWADPGHLAALAGDLEALSSPTLILWGERDGWFGPELAGAWSGRVPNAALELVPDAGHWPWLDRPELIERVAGFLAAP